MTKYGIKLVSAGWKDDNVIGFSHTGRNRFGGDIVAGTRMLLYETAAKVPSGAKGTKTIVGEVEVTGTFDDGEKIRAADEPHDVVVPVKVLKPRRDGKSITLERTREIIEDAGWPRMGESWKTLSKETYERLAAELEK